MSRAFYGNFEQFLCLDMLSQKFSHWLSGRILQISTILSYEIAVTLQSVGFIASNLLLDASQKCLTCE